MLSIRVIKNQYRGINAHLHSYLQKSGRWDEFHFNHIPDIMRLMSELLLPMGYVADVTQSLQIRRAEKSAGKPESDITIYDQDPLRTHKTTYSGTVHAAAVAIPDIMTVEEELAEYKAVAIYKYIQEDPDLGEPVAWIELLSPSNKPGGQDADYYRDKRLKLIHSGIVFVELDYLHESPPTFEKFPNYAVSRRRPRDAQAHPYHIVVVDPRPSLTEGLAYPYHFAVDDPIPTVEIPLKQGDIFSFDFGAAYHKTLRETRYDYRFVDYATLPVNFARYSEDDQARILTRMLHVIQNAQNNEALSREPEPLEVIPLRQALVQFEALTAS